MELAFNSLFVQNMLSNFEPNKIQKIQNKKFDCAIDLHPAELSMAGQAAWQFTYIFLFIFPTNFVPTSDFNQFKVWNKRILLMSFENFDENAKNDEKNRINFSRNKIFLQLLRNYLC